MGTKLVMTCTDIAEREPDDGPGLQSQTILSSPYLRESEPREKRPSLSAKPFYVLLQDGERAEEFEFCCDLATAQRFRVGATYLVTVEEG